MERSFGVSPSLLTVDHGMVGGGLILTQVGGYFHGQSSHGCCLFDSVST